jgi:putative colanic acid biosynthesis acetyltransferase WcaF
METTDLQPEQNFYDTQAFSLGNRLRRFAWIVCWALLCRWTPRPLHGWRVLILRLFGGRIGKQNSIYPNCKIWAPWLLRTGDLVTIGPNVEVYNPGGVSLGHHVILSQDSYLCGATHDYDVPEFTYIKKPIVLEPYVWICARAVVLPGVHGGEGAVLGAAGLTSRDLKPWTLYAGNPCREVRKRVNFLTDDNPPAP